MKSSIKWSAIALVVATAVSATCQAKSDTPKIIEVLTD
jgi:hypothetical protein